MQLFHFRYFSITGEYTDLGYCAIEWFILETNRDPSACYTSSDLSPSLLHQLWKDTHPHRKYTHTLKLETNTYRHKLQFKAQGNRQTGNLHVFVPEEAVLHMKYRDYDVFIRKSPF